MKIIILICIGFQFIWANPNNSAKDIDDAKVSIKEDPKLKVITTSDDTCKNDPKGPCDEDYWTAKLKGTVRDDQTYCRDGEKVVEMKRKAFLNGCEAMTRNIDPNRLVFYFKDDDCKVFDFARCN